MESLPQRKGAAVKGGRGRRASGRKPLEGRERAGIQNHAAAGLGYTREMDTLQTTKRSKRFVRRSIPPAFQLTDRDLKLLGHVARHRFLSSDHLITLDGGSAQNVLRSLRVLFDHQYLDRPIAQLNYVPITGPQPLVYGLGRRGARALREQGSLVSDTDWTERNKRAGAKFIAHTLAIADFMVALEAVCEKPRSGVKLLYEREILARAPTATRNAREPLRLVVPGIDKKVGISSVIPDGLFGLEFGDGSAAYFLLEIDRGSMPVFRSTFDQTSYQRKLLMYWEAWKRKVHVHHFGIAQARVLTLTDSLARVENMLRAVDNVTAGKGSNFFLFTTMDKVRERSPLEVQWVSGRGAQVRLID